MTVKVNSQLVQHYLALIGLVFMTCFNSTAMLTNDTDYSCHIKAFELIEPIIWGSYHATSY